uniref:PARP16 N-terminal domain-containing protein n=1 Tax=Cacopsylla melanoneura TaxID=428564 RepID=A0A8D8LY26_9HEMI
MPEAENNIKGMLPKEKDLQESVDNVTRNNGEVAQSSLSSPQTSTINTKIIELKQSLAKSKLGCDIKWSIFVSACHSYRVSSCLHPFPTMFIKDGLKDISAVVYCQTRFNISSPIFTTQFYRDELVQDESFENFSCIPWESPGELSLNNAFWSSATFQ